MVKLFKDWKVAMSIIVLGFWNNAWYTVIDFYLHENCKISLAFGYWWNMVENSLKYTFYSLLGEKEIRRDGEGGKKIERVPRRLWWRKGWS